MVGYLDIKSEWPVILDLPGHNQLQNGKAEPIACERSLSHPIVPIRLIWKVLHEGVSYVEYGPAPTPIILKRRRQRLVTQLKNLGYEV